MKNTRTGNITETSNDIHNCFLSGRGQLPVVIYVFFPRFLCNVYCIPNNKSESEWILPWFLNNWSNSDLSWTQHHIAALSIHSPDTLLVTPVQLLGNTIANQPINAFRHLDVVKTTWTEHQNGEERGFKWLNVVVGARRTGLSFQKLLIYWDFHTQPSLVFTRMVWKREISSEAVCGWKCLVDVRGQRRMDRLVRDDRKTTVTQITTRYNQDLQNTISEHTTHRTLKQMDSRNMKISVL